MYTINKALGGKIDDKTILQLGNGFCGGMGGGDGTCGALTGAVSILGVFLSPHDKKGLSKKKARLASKELHDKFKEEFSSITCSDLTEEFKNKRIARKKNCQKITGVGAEICAQIILKHRPELALKADDNFLAQKDSKLSFISNKLSSIFS